MNAPITAMMLPDAWTNPQMRYHPEQARLWTYTGRFAAVRAGRQSGKTEFASRKLVLKLPDATWHGKPGNYAYVAPTRDQAKRIIWARLKALVSPSWVRQISETELFIESIWGSRIYVCGFDVPARLEGTPWDFVIVDESSDIKPKQVDLVILPALAYTKGKLWRIGIPKRTGIGAAEFRKVCEDRTLGYEYFYWSAEDLIDPEECETQKSRLSAQDYDEQIRGLAVEQGGLAYFAFSNGPAKNVPNDLGNVRVGELTHYDPNRMLIIGSDFNVNPMCWCIVQMKVDTLCVIDEIRLHNTNTRATLDYLWSKYGDHKGGFLFMGDAAGKARKTVATNAAPSDYILIRNDGRFATHGVQVKYPDANPPVKDRLASVNAMLKNAQDVRRIAVNPQCLHLIDDFLTRAVDTHGTPTKATEDYGHMADAFGYIVHGLFPVQNSTQPLYETPHNKSTISLTVVN